MAIARWKIQTGPEWWPWELLTCTIFKFWTALSGGCGFGTFHGKNTICILREMDLKCLNCGGSGHKTWGTFWIQFYKKRVQVKSNTIYQLRWEWDQVKSNSIYIIVLRWECPDHVNVTSSTICGACGGVGHVTRDCKNARCCQGHHRWSLVIGHMTRDCKNSRVISTSLTTLEIVIYVQAYNPLAQAWSGVEWESRRGRTWRWVWGVYERHGRGGTKGSLFITVMSTSFFVKRKKSQIQLAPCLRSFTSFHTYYMSPHLFNHYNV